MVRLKDLRRLNVAFAMFRFNSNVVRLKESPPIVAPALEISFNSNVVRLKAWLSCEEEKVEDLFQFQCGAIKSLKPSFVKFSFCCFNSNVVQLKAEKHGFCICGIYVSIPMWCD